MKDCTYKTSPIRGGKEKIMERPWLIQRCALLPNGKMTYDYMGSTEFEIGRQSESLERIFAAGMALDCVNVNIGGKEIPVYMVASSGFSFAEYQPYLQQLAEGKLQLQESARFDDFVRVRAGIPTVLGCSSGINVWFDFKNDVLWTLTEENQRALVAVLDVIKKRWAEKK